MYYKPLANPQDYPKFRDTLEHLEIYGYCIMGDMDPGQRQEVCYSVGMTQHGFPEVIAGMEDFAHVPGGSPGILNALVSIMLDDEHPVGDGDVMQLGGQWVRLVPQTLYMPLCDILLGLYGSEFTLLQAIICEPNPSQRIDTRPICLN